MIEELRDYLVRYGVSEVTADEIHDVYYDGDMQGVAVLFLEDERFVALVIDWLEEVGEATPERKEWLRRTYL